MNPSKLRNTGRWQIAFYKDGKRFKASYDTKRDAQAALDEMRGRVRRNEFVPPKDIPTLREASGGWLRGKQGYRYSSVSAWAVHLNKHILPKLGEMRLDQMEVGHVRKLRDDLRASLSAQTINKVLTTLAAIFKYAMRDNPHLINPAALAERARVGGDRIATAGALKDGETVGERPVDPSDCLNPTEISALLRAARPGFYRTIFMTAALTGMRSGELLGLQWGDLKLDGGPGADGKIFVRQSLSWVRGCDEDENLAPRFYEPKTKSGKREISICPELAHALKEWHLRAAPSPFDLVFPSPDGSPFHRSVLNSRGLRPALCRAKLRRVTFHSLRHSHASLMFAEGASITEVCARMGHRDASVTLKVYSHFIPSRDSGASRRVANAVLADMKELLIADTISDRRPQTAPEPAPEWEGERKSA